MNHIITFSGAPYEETTGLTAEFCAKAGIDFMCYDDKWLEEHPFRQLNRWLWDHPMKRGCGWYAWKPLVIIDALGRVAPSPSDVVLYLDADAYPVADLSALFRQCEQDGGIMLFSATGHKNVAWCKSDCFLAMGQDEDKIDQAAVARYVLFQKGPWVAQQFLMEWLTYCVNPLCNTFDPSIHYSERPGFVEHRCEQAILTLLAYKYGLKLYREPDQHGNLSSQDVELYEQLFVHDNRRPLETRQTTAPVEGSRYRNV